MSDEVRNEVDGWAARAERIAVAGEQVALVDVAPDRPGGAPPLLVVHGFPTSSIDFSPVVGRLAAERRVVLVDLPGYGLSDKPTGRTRCSGRPMWSRRWRGTGACPRSTC